MPPAARAGTGFFILATDAERCIAAMNRGIVAVSVKIVRSRSVASAWALVILEASSSVPIVRQIIGVRRINVGMTVVGAVVTTIVKIAMTISSCWDSIKNFKTFKLDELYYSTFWIPLNNYRISENVLGSNLEK